MHFMQNGEVFRLKKTVEIELIYLYWSTQCNPIYALYCIPSLELVAAEYFP